MAIEPLGSIMNMQMQSVQSKPVQTAKPAAEYTEGTAPEQVKVDNTTNVVVQSQNKGNPNEENDKRQAGHEQVKQAVDRLNKKMGNAEAVFGIHDDTNRVMIKIIDRDTKEVIKELPPEKTLDMIAKVWELAGIMVDEKR